MKKKISLFLIFIASNVLSQTVCKIDTTEVISRYSVKIDYNDGFLPIKETAAKVLGFHTEELILEEKNWIDENGEKQFSLKLRKPDDKVWFYIFSDTACYSFLQAPLQPRLGMDATTIRFLRDLKQYAGETAFQGMKTRIHMGGLILNAVVELDTSPTKPNPFITPESKKYSIRTENDQKKGFISSKIVAGFFKNNKVFPFAFFDIREDNIKITLELKDVQVRTLPSVLKK